MRLARVFLASSSMPVPLSALMRDGCLYDIAELSRAFGLPVEEPTSAVVDDFFGRVLALGCAGLEALDERLFHGDRPSSARLAADEIVWLPPCLPERALWVALESAPAKGPATPRYHLGNARSLFGHQASVPFPNAEATPIVEVAVAALLGEELFAATAEQAERAVIGYSVLLGFYAPSEVELSGPCRARDFAAMLGPTLVTKDEAGEVADRVVRLRVRGEIIELGRVIEDPFVLAESIAFASQHITLAPGDIISTPPLRGVEVAFGETFDVIVERLGKLSARPAHGPTPPPFRSVARTCR